MAGIEQVPAGRLTMFITLTFPEADAPDEDAAHAAWRSLVGRLRYRNQLGAFGWVLQRQRNGTPHFHGIAHMPWLDDDLAEWWCLIAKSGFGVQNKLVVAQTDHAGYCAKYISTRLAVLAPLRQAYGFSRDFPRTDYDAFARLLTIRHAGTEDHHDRLDPDELQARAEACGVEADDNCDFVPAHALYA